MSLTDGQPYERVQAWQVEYANEALADTAAIAAIRQPRAAWAYARPVEAAAALADDTTPTADANGLLFIFVPSGTATAYEVQKQAERWMASRAGEQDGILEVLFRSERLLWRRGRAVCFGTPEFINDMLAAVAHFSFCEGELRKLEHQAESACVAMDENGRLTDKLSGRALKLRPHVDAMTRMATSMQVTYMRVERALEAPAPEFSGPARRVFVELTLLATIENRLLRLDDAVDTIAEHYRFVNERFADYRYFRREYWIIVLILLVLVFESLVASQELLRSWGTYLSEQARIYLPWLVGP
jgi:hypothetical protein